MREELPFSAEDLARWNETIPTPFYVYDEEGIADCVENLKKAFSWNEGFREYFAVKAAPTPAILRLLSSLGCGADCASIPELMLAKGSGMRGEEIILSSNQTLDAEYKFARDIGAIINLDDITQIDHLARSAGIPDTVCLRFNPGKFSTSNDIIGRPDEAKFGLTEPQLIDGYRELKARGVKHFGLHSMPASCCLDNDYYPELSRLLFGLVLTIRDLAGVDIEFVDLSGGVGIPYRPGEEPVDIYRIGDDVRKIYEEFIEYNGLKIKIYTEMGRYITGPYGYLIAMVVGFKHIYKEYVGLDATAADLMRPAIYGAYHHIRVPGREDRSDTVKVDVVGSLCENNDKFAVDRVLPRLEEGDIVVIEDAGAHGHAMGYNYNGKLRSAEYLMDKNKNLSCIRRAQTVEDYFGTLDVDKEFRY